ncbi:hypothetical protein CsSME_00052522 [Camellia sinensis var. sinensis]
MLEKAIATPPTVSPIWCSPLLEVLPKLTLHAPLSLKPDEHGISESLSEQRRKKLQAKEAELRRREQDVYMYFRGSGKAAEMKREAAKRTMMAALP